MKKFFSMLGVASGVVITVLIALMCLGMYINSKAVTAVKDQGYTTAYVTNDIDRVLCLGSGVGVIVAAKKDNESIGYFPICSPVFGKATMGVWVDERE